jgi:hypothetical protein
MNCRHKDVDVLMYICSLDTACSGINSNGQLIYNSSAISAAPGITLYTKKLQ